MPVHIRFFTARVYRMKAELFLIYWVIRRQYEAVEDGEKRTVPSSVTGSSEFNTGINIGGA